MRIRMVQERTGPRWDGRAWPPVGGEIDVADEEGAAVCAAGWAVPVPTGKPEPETPEDPLKPSEEHRTPPPQAPATGDGKPAVNAPKADWVAYAVTKGATSTDAEAMTKEQLVKRYGG